MRTSASGGQTTYQAGSILGFEGPPLQGTATPQASSRSPIAGSGHNWGLYHTNRKAWAAAKELLRGAEASIAIEQYIFSHRGIGREVLEIVTEQARRGVEVRILADAFGSPHLLQSEAGQALLRAGGRIVIFNPLRNGFRDPSSLFHRLHRKCLICDGRYLMTGGSCFHPRMEDWRDTMVILDDKQVAADALAVFDGTWTQASSGALPSLGPSALPDPQTPREWSYMVSSPYGQAGRDYYNELLHRIDEARHTVTLASPYLTPVGRFWTTMERATRRGVRVRVMIPKRSDQPLIDAFSLNFARKLLGRGIEVYGFLRGMMHAKLAVVDDRWAAVGSFNLGIDSIRMNLEGVLVSRSPDFHDALVEQLEADLSHSRRL
jgi:cardiolipin synthase A/B